MVLNVTANKNQVIQMIVNRLRSIQVPRGKSVVITGPEPQPVQVGIGEWQTAITHEEADINEVVKHHAAVYPNLLGAHALSGCDSVSSFVGIGKVTVLKKLMRFTDSLSLSDPSASLDQVIDSSVKFVATLYGKEHGYH